MCTSEDRRSSCLASPCRSNEYRRSQTSTSMCSTNHHRKERVLSSFLWKLRTNVSRRSRVGRDSKTRSSLATFAGCSELESDALTVSYLEMCAAEDQNDLHVALLSYPTLKIVEDIIENAPELLFQLNSLGQTPLHVASARGSSPQVVNYLLQQYGEAASMQDSKGRTPLHLACACSRLCDTGNEPTSGSRDLRKGPLYSVVKILCKAAPDSVNMEDEDGVCALEYAICAETHMKIVRTLHRASENAWKGVMGMEGDFFDGSMRDSTVFPQARRSRFSQLRMEDRCPMQDCQDGEKCNHDLKARRPRYCHRCSSIPPAA